MSLSLRIGAALAGLVLFAGAAAADETRRAETIAATTFEKPFPGDHPCMCRAFGVAYEPGERICIGARLAECVIDINVMSWRTTREPCPRV